MTPLPPQTPQRRRAVAFRPRSDTYTMPTFRAPMTPRVVVQPIETYDPANEARPFEWDELRDPEVIVGGFTMFMAFVAIVVLVFLSSVA